MQFYVDSIIQIAVLRQH